MFCLLLPIILYFSMCILCEVRISAHEQMEGILDTLATSETSASFSLRCVYEKVVQFQFLFLLGKC